MTRRKTQEEFIEQVKNLLGDKYDLSKVEYVSSNDKVTVICKEHGEFSVTPSNLLRGRGCPKCGLLTRTRKRASSTEEFVKKVKEIHGDRYDFSLVEYKNNRTQVTIICPIHGEVMCHPYTLLRGAGCKYCGGRVQWTTPEFIEKSKEVHGDRFDYSQTEYVSAHIKVKVVCREHGVFSISPAAHIHQRQGCPICGGSAKGDTESFVKKAENKHGKRYIYTEVDYKNVKTKVTVICPEHGKFQIFPIAHTRGGGCPSCAKYGFDRLAPAVIYVLECESIAGKFTGYGITKELPRPLSKHRKNLAKYGFQITDAEYYFIPKGITAQEIEQCIIKKFTEPSRLGREIAGFKKESTDTNFHNVVEFVSNLLDKKGIEYKVEEAQ